MPQITMPKSLDDEAQHKWHQYLQAAKDAGAPALDDVELAAVLQAVFTVSEFVAGVCIRHPDLLVSLVEGNRLTGAPNPAEMAPKLADFIDHVEDEAELMRRLRLFRKREMTRIAIRDLSGWADLNATMADLSALADACLDQALAVLYGWQCARKGTPVNAAGEVQHLVVLGMGKLGARELNFSSDVDLVLAYPDSGQTTGGGAALTNEEFFLHLGRQLIKVISNPTADGFVFRVDTNLRPFGEGGPLVMSFDAMEDYFASQGREWERYAWIKARAVAGDRRAGRRLLKALQPFVFRRYLDYGVFESLREMKQMITLEVRRKGIAGNVKLGAGGIREIEFFGQMFQLIRGGVVPKLQSRRILKVLDLLASDGYIDRAACQKLSDAYVFLRHTEHRLQAARDRQTHQLPTDPEERTQLAAAMGFDDYEAFKQVLADHMNHVHQRFRGLLEKQQRDTPTDGKARRINDLETLWLRMGASDDALVILKQAGFETPQQVIQLLESYRGDPHTRALSVTGRRRLDRLMPCLLEEVGASGHPGQALARIIDLLKAVQQRTSYLSLLIENPSAVGHLVTLANASPFIISYLSRYPVLLDELLDHRTLYKPPQKEALQADLARRLGHVAPDDLEHQIEELCIFKQSNTLRVAAADVSGGLPLMKVSDRLTWIAEAAVDITFDLAWEHLVERYGLPAAHLDGRSLNRGFVVIAYGKLGGIELGYGSDLDLVFLHAGQPGETRGGKLTTDNAQFYGRLGQRIIHLLTAHTPAGVLYRLDMRLRPSGEKGILVSHIDAFREYQLNQAWTWEHQALVRARPICGDLALIDYFQQIRAEVLTLKRDRKRLQDDVRDMRRRMRKERDPHDPEVFDVKNDPGGIVDIEFLVQYLTLCHAHEYPALTDWTDNVRLLQVLIKTGIFNQRQAHFIKEAYLHFRATVHRLSLQEKPSRIASDRYGELRQHINRLWEDFMEDQRP